MPCKATEESASVSQESEDRKKPRSEPLLGFPQERQERAE